jgi:inner membrane transporter RhtA
VVPYAADLIALRRVPARLFGVAMSIHPVLAALAGLVLLGQRLYLHESLGIAIVVATNALAVVTADRHAPRRVAAGRSARAARRGSAAGSAV